jgi:hypothetical protein
MPINWLLGSLSNIAVKNGYMIGVCIKVHITFIIYMMTNAVSLNDHVIATLTAKTFVAFVSHNASYFQISTIFG